MSYVEHKSICCTGQGRHLKRGRRRRVERTMIICALETDKDAVGGTKTVNVGEETEIMRKISQ